jgi:hypothetical protein
MIDPSPEGLRRIEPAPEKLAEKLEMKERRN